MGIVLLLLLVVLVGLPAAGLLAIIDDAPAVADQAAAGPEETRRARDLGQRLRRLLQGDGGQVVALTVQEAEINSILRLAAPVLPGLSSRVVIDGGGMRAATTLRLPENPIGRFANLTVRLEPAEEPPGVNLHMGTFGLPGAAAGWLLERLADSVYGPGTGEALASAIEGAEFEPGRVALRLRPSPAVVAALKESPRLGLEAARSGLRPVEPYYQRLSEVGQRLAKSRKVSLHQYLGPLFELAAARATPETAAEENRAALIALAAVFGDSRFERIAGVSPTAPRPDKERVALGDRHDFMQHFVISAGLAATGGGSVADAIGVLKEVDDSRFGTGFSFTDIAADRAGVRFAEAALDPARAQAVQRIVGKSGREDRFFPRVADLPEFLDEAAFKRRFGGVDSPAYRSQLTEIERRIDALPLHRGG